jgi:threonine aldolase
MVFFTWPPAAEDEKTAARIVEAFKKQKITISLPEKGAFRFVTHFWIGDAEAEAVIAASRVIFRKKEQSF